jgi:hypothetical protein
MKHDEVKIVAAPWNLSGNLTYPTEQTQHPQRFRRNSTTDVANHDSFS